MRSSIVLRRPVTGYFDKNTLVSAFFPNLIFWGITISVIEFLKLGLFGTESKWSTYTGLSPVSQALIFVVFLLWITFCSYLTITLQPTLIRLYEGYWPNVQPFKILQDKMCSSWEHQWNQKNNRDLKLEEERVELEIKKTEDNTPEKLRGILDKIDKIEEERLKIQYELFYRCPEKKDYENPNRFYVAPMPTELGNVIKAAELYSLIRYNLDATLIWPRLVPLLPKNFVDYLQNSETPLVLMVTLSAFSLIFGIPLSFLIGWISPIWLIWWIPLLVSMISLVLRLYAISTLALISFLIELFLKTNNVQSWPLQIHTFSILLAVTLLISNLSYLTAVQAALDYGDRIRSAFDLYRFKILEGLSLQLPSTLEEELITWDQVCGLIYRNYKVNPQYYRYEKNDNTEDNFPK
ncbi:hypothetical protein ACSAZK_16065 [Methanosarcina sp. Mfa9]|uniref:hypothetical protein n=1 Tax=Methanosarcina sp. Mfa9 TaxID=3439063 RepID=UPI003F876E8B